MPPGDSPISQPQDTLGPAVPDTTGTVAPPATG